MKKLKLKKVLALVFVALFPLLLMGTGLYFCYSKPGFSIGKISSKLPYNENWEIPSLTQGQKEMLVGEVLSQPFYFLGSGLHTYAFESEDRKFVLKFFKMPQFFKKEVKKDLPFSFLEKIQLKNGKNNALFLENIFNSYKDAYDHLRDESGMIYIHFNKTREFRSKVTLVDTLGKKYKVDLDEMVFVVQHKAQKIFDTLALWVENKEEDKAREGVHSFLKMIAHRSQQGFVDSLLHIRTNFGFVGSKAIQFDCSSFYRDDSMRYPLNFRREIINAADRLIEWANESCPSLCVVIQEEAERIINSDTDHYS